MTNSSTQVQSSVMVEMPPDPAVKSRHDSDNDLLQTWPKDLASSQSMSSAFSDLAGLWNLVYDTDKPDYCSSTIEYGLDCLVRKDSLDTLRKMNRPAILTLYDDDGVPFPVVMAQLKDDRAVFIAGDKQYELALSAIASHWFGEYILLWKKPPIQHDELLKPGQRGEWVDWLAETLQKLQLYNATGQEVRLDGLLLGAFKHFQFSSGLTPDGVLGPMTLIRLNTACNLAGPRLYPQGAG